MAELTRGQILKNPEVIGAATAGGKLILWDGDETNTVALKSPDSVTTDIVFTLPGVDGSPSQVLSTNGSGILSWATAAAGAGGNSGEIQYNNAGGLSGISKVESDGTNLILTEEGELRFADTDSSNYVAFKAPGVVAANRTLTLPALIGSVGEVLGIATGASATAATLEWVPSGTPITVGTTAPVSPAVGDLWVDTN